MKNRLGRMTLALAFVFLGACHDMGNMGDMGDMGDMGNMGGMPPAVLQVTPSEGPFDTAAAPDLDPAPNVVEVALEARVAPIEIAPGRNLSMWTYNGQLPGPRIEARVGDTVRVRFKNSLPEPTTIHWHGVRVPAAMDGAPAVQSPIASGAEFIYEFVVKDAGTFWYHPHVRSDEQVERGLYGAFVVRGEQEPSTTSERTVVLDDLLLDARWQLAPFDSAHAMVGRQGNVILANGWAQPIVRAERGGLHRFRLINAANARYFRLALPGHRLIQIGTDGGMLSTPRELDELLLVPGERADLLVVTAGEPGALLPWKSLPYERGHSTGTLPETSVFHLRHDQAPPLATPSLPTSFAGPVALDAPTVRRDLTLAESMTMHGTGHGAGMDAVFSINGQVYPASTPLRATLDTEEEWSIANTTTMDHPFHLHGFRFQIVSIAGAPPAITAWRDTINIPATSTVRIRLRLEDHPGTWMFHCHILEHAERGMMGELEVAPS